MKKEDTIIVIDTASTEFNRGSFCYLPYIIYSYLKNHYQNVLFVENATVAVIDTLPKADDYLISVWSWPQVDATMVFDRFLPKRPLIFGYKPFIEKYGWREFPVTELMIKEGIESYYYYFNSFQYILLSDCDMHLRQYEGMVYPLFTSYGCTNQCTFCPVHVNTSRKRIIIEEAKVIDTLVDFHRKGYVNIHLTDEDFFFDAGRVFRILTALEDRKFPLRFIALAGAVTLSKYLKMYGWELLQKYVKVIEVGLETADPALGSGMKKSVASLCEGIAKECAGKLDIFWLTMTFFPGETIQTLNATGEFLSRNGFKIEQLYSRIATNSSEGGLGQFFQPYPGTIDCSSLGEMLTERPIRLLPSFIPNSFLESVVKECRLIKEEEQVWFDLYRLPLDLFSVIEKGKTIRDILGRVPRGTTKAAMATFLAVCARLRVIE